MEQERPHPGISIAEAPFSSLLLQVVRAHALLAAEILQEVGVVPPQEVVLLYLDEHGPCPQREIVRFMGRDRSTVSNTLQAMERAGLIRREPSDRDLRALVVSLTEKGHALVPRVRAAWTEIEKRTFSGLKEDRLSALAEALAEVKAALARALAGGDRSAPPL